MKGCNVMNNIHDKIWDKTILDSEIIRDIEHVKCNYPKFDINCVDRYNWLLMNAVDCGREELVRYLLLTYPDINVNHRSKQGNTVLHLCNQVSILKLLLDHKDIDINMQNNSKETELHWACWLKREACIRELLLDARVNVLIRDNKGYTARDYALERGYPDIAQIIRISGRTSLLRIPNRALLHDIVRMIIEEYV